MITATRERTLQWITNQYKKGNISFSHRLQRPIGQWSPRMKSLLIHSLLTGIPINPIYVVEENNILYTLDGSQRVSTCIDYINNKFAISKDIPNITLLTNENGEQAEREYIIAGKKFSKLDEEVRNTLLACGLQFCMLTSYTDTEVNEMFSRQNSGKPLSNKLLRVTKQSSEFGDMIYSLTQHPFMNKLVTKTQKKNGADRDLIVQSLMLINTTQDKEFLSFRSKDIDSFIVDYGDNCIEKSEYIKEVFNKLDSAFEEIKIPITTAPMMIYAGYRVVKNKGSFSKFIELVNSFIDTYNENEEYKQFVSRGTTSIENVRGRFEYWKTLIKSI